MLMGSIDIPRKVYFVTCHNVLLVMKQKHSFYLILFLTWNRCISISVCLIYYGVRMIFR